MSQSSSHAIRSWAVKRAARRYEARWKDAAGATRAAKGSREQGRFVPFATRKGAEAFAAEQAASAAAEQAPRTGMGRPETVDALLDTFLEFYARGVGTRKGKPPDKGTVKAVAVRLLYARKAFGDRVPDSLRKLDLETWRQDDVPPRMRHDAFRAFRQALRWALEHELMDKDVSAGIYNPAPKAHERSPRVAFADWSEVEAVTAEFDPRWSAIPAVLCGTALRPGELFGLFVPDVEFDHARRCGAITVRRRYTKGELKEGTKTDAPSRRVPFGPRVYDAFRSMPPRIGSGFLFTAARGGPVNQEQFAARVWGPAVRAAGLEARPMYAARHTAITWWLAAGVPIDTVAAWAGTSIKMIEQHYRESIPAHDEFALRPFGEAGSTLDALKKSGVIRRR